MIIKGIHNKLSQLFLWGFEGTEISRDTKRLIKEFLPAGVILFKRNLESKAQIKALTEDYYKVAGRSFLIGIDEEGGRVGRLPDPLEHFPPPAIYGEIFIQEKSFQKITESARRLARQLKDLGINTNFAPVLDVHSNPDNPIIGDRAFSSDPDIAAKAATAFYLGMDTEHIISCGKHFPGHGDTSTDSHLTLPHVSRPRWEIEAVELVPFRRAIRERIPMIMTAHVVYKSLDTKNPATFSKKILTDLLRKQMKYSGVIISDDLQMKAVSRKHSLAESAILSLAAGVDIILICREGEKGGRVVEEVAREVAKSPILRRRVNESYRRVSLLKRKYLKR